MSAGEMQAAATGNMDMLREIQLRTEVRSWSNASAPSRRSATTWRAAGAAPKEIAELPPMIERFDKAASAAEQYNKGAAHARGSAFHDQRRHSPIETRP